MMGYTQSGKTTLFNRLASESKDVGLGPFTTLSTFARKIPSKKSGQSFIMIDSIGFIEDLNSLLLNAFQTTLNELANSDLILLFVDGSEDIGTVTRKISVSHEMLEKEVKDVPLVICVNKVDVATREHLDQVLEEVGRVFEGEEIMEISSKTGTNVPDLLERIAEKIGGDWL